MDIDIKMSLCMEINYNADFKVKIYLAINMKDYEEPMAMEIDNEYNNKQIKTNEEPMDID